MPLTPVNELPPNPAVRIFFSGLMIIQPNEDGSHCEIFVNRSAVDHEFSVEVREKRANKPDAVFMRHFGPLSFIPPPEDELTFGLHLIASNPKGLNRYTGGPLAGGEDSFDLAIDLKGEDFHRGSPVEVDVKAGRPSISLNDGTFYAADKASDELEIVKKQGGEEQGPAGSFATLIGTNIYLEDQDVLRVRWLRLGLPQVFELQKPPEGSSYEIYIQNDPLFVDPQAAGDHDEFGEYYRMLPSIPTEDRFAFDIPEEAFTDEKGTPRTLCFSVALGATGGP